MTWQELDTIANRAATGLLALGARPDDVVGLLADNSAETLAMVYGASRAGVTWVPLSPRLTRAEVQWQLGDVSATRLVSSNGEGGWSVADVLAKGTDTGPDDPADPHGYFWIRFTSGTTGRPKAVATTQQASAALFTGLATELGCVPEGTLLVNAPIAHAAIGLAAGQVAVGGSMVIEPGFDKDRVWISCDEHRITHLFMVPTMLTMALDSPGHGDSIEAILSMASAFSVTLKQRVRDRFPKAGIYDAYGGSEFGAATMLRPSEMRDRPSSVGLPRFGCRIKILDDQGRELPPGEIGQIYLQGPMLCSAWVGSVQPSPGTVRGEWLSAGDLGYKDEQGYLYIADRRDDLIVSGGLNVYPGEVEGTLERVEGVREIAVIGVPHPEWGHQVVAVVVGDATVESLDRHCRAELAGYKVPRRYEYVDEMPRNASGKLLRRVLRDRFTGDGDVG